MIGALFVLALALPPAQDAGAALADLGSADPAVRTRGACTLRDVGGLAAPAVPRLAALLADGSQVDEGVCGDRTWRTIGHPDHLTSPGEQAASALLAIGSAAYDVFAGALKSPAWIARTNAAWGLGALRDTRAVALLLPLLRDPEPPVRATAAWSLGVLRDREAVTPLVAALKDGDPRVRYQAAWAIGVIGR